MNSIGLVIRKIPNRRLFVSASPRSTATVTLQSIRRDVLHTSCKANTSVAPRPYTTKAGEMQITEESIRKALYNNQVEYCDVKDTSGGCGQAFEAIIVSREFDEEMAVLKRIRLVNSKLKDEIAAIHAWSPKCYTPSEWQSIQGSQ